MDCLAHSVAQWQVLIKGITNFQFQRRPGRRNGAVCAETRLRAGGSLVPIPTVSRYLFLLKECHPRCVYQNYSRSKSREVAVKNTTIFVGTIIYQLHVSALIGHLQVGIQHQSKISIISIGMGGRDLVYKCRCPTS